MDEQEYTYIELIKELDEIFPPTTEFDYTKLSPDELWNKIDSFINKHGFTRQNSTDRIIQPPHINAAELESLKRTIFNAQEVLYGMDHVARSGNIANENHGFDQNNYFS